MSTPLFDDLPAPLKSVQTRPLFVMRLDVKPIVIVGETPGPFRRVGIVPSGTFAGERLSGKVLDGGADWQTVRRDASTTLDVRLILQTDDGVNITMAYRGVRHGPPMSCSDWKKARKSTRQATTSASTRCSKRLPESMSG